MASSFFFFNDTSPTELYTLSLHDALPIYGRARCVRCLGGIGSCAESETSSRAARVGFAPIGSGSADRKSTRLNSSHVRISYAVFCLKKKNISPVMSHVMHAAYRCPQLVRA